VKVLKVYSSRNEHTELLSQHLGIEYSRMQF